MFFPTFKLEYTYHHLGFIFIYIGDQPATIKPSGNITVVSKHDLGQLWGSQQDHGRVGCACTMTGGTIGIPTLREGGVIVRDYG